MATSKDAAEWLHAQLLRHKEYYQEDAVAEIERKFGKDFVYDNENGNPAIAKPVLAAFRKLSGDHVVWVRSERYWRLRERGDSSSRQQE